jgi:hypothetical protein
MEWNVEIVRTGTCKFWCSFITSSSLIDRFLGSRDGDRIFPAPPRPEEKSYNQEA